MACLARSANLPTRLYILLSKISCFLNRPKIAQHLLDRFSRSLHHMKGICVSLFDLDIFSRFLKGLCHGNRFWAKFAKWPLFNTLAFWNGFDYRNFDLKRFNGDIFSTYCANLVKIGPVTPEITWAKTISFGEDSKNGHFVPNYSACTGLIATTISKLVEWCMPIIKLK